MRRRVGVAAATLVFLAACAGDGDLSDGERAPECPTELIEALSAWEDAGFSGSIAVSTASEFDCRAGFGEADRSDGMPNTPDTVYSIGSVSKAFTAAAVAGLVDDGRVALTDRAGDVVPGLRGAAADATIKQLLLHTSGLSGSHGADHEPLSRSQAIAAINTMRPAFTPGTDHLYSNSGYTLLAAVVEEAAQTSFREYLTARILRLPDGDVAGGFWDGRPAAAGPRAIGYHQAGATSAMGEFAGPHWALQGNGDLADDDAGSRGMDTRVVHRTDHRAGRRRPDQRHYLDQRRVRDSRLGRPPGIGLRSAVSDQYRWGRRYRARGRHRVGSRRRASCGDRVQHARDHGR